MRLWNRTRKNKSRGQATTELAICATLIIVMFAAMLRYGQTMNFQQQLQMKAFRQALKYSRDKGREVSYTIIKDKRGVNPFNFFGVPEDNRLMASATAAWIKSDLNLLDLFGAKDEVEDYYELNSDIKKLDSIKVKATFKKNLLYPVNRSMDLWMPIMVLEPQYRKERDVDAKIERKETHSGITTERSYSVSRDIQTKLVMYDKEDMEREILKSLNEEQSRREKAKEEARNIIEDLVVETLFAVGLSLLDLDDFAHESIESVAELVKYLEFMFIGTGSWEDALIKVVGYVAAFTAFKYLLGALFGHDPEVVDVEIVKGYRKYETWQEQVPWEGGSSWQASF